MVIWPPLPSLDSPPDEPDPPPHAAPTSITTTAIATTPSHRRISPLLAPRSSNGSDNGHRYSPGPRYYERAGPSACSGIGRRVRSFRPGRESLAQGPRVHILAAR